MMRETEDNRIMQPIPSETVVQQIIERITDAIACGTFKLGEKLPSEYELMKELNVSRNSLREAMKIMSATGIVKIKRGDGTYVNQQIDPSFFDHIIYGLIFEASTDQEIVELRQTLDEAVLQLALHKVTDEDIEELQNYINKMREAFRVGNVAKASKYDYQFHIYLVEACKNSLLSRIVKGVYQLFESSIENNIRTVELFASADQHHQEIVDCLKAKDSAKVPEVVRRSLSSWKNQDKKKKKN